jgi:hypothetical protein
MCICDALEMSVATSKLTIVDGEAGVDQAGFTGTHRLCGHTPYA